jgi:hypothetical protein
VATDRADKVRAAKAPANARIGRDAKCLRNVEIRMTNVESKSEWLNDESAANGVTSILLTGECGA